MKINLAINNKVLVEPYKKTEVRAEIRGGMAVMAQKATLVGLKLKSNARVFINGFYQDLYEGDVAYFRENALHTNPAIRDVCHADCIEGDFLVLDASLIQFVNQDAPEENSSRTLQD